MNELEDAIRQIEADPTDVWFVMRDGKDVAAIVSPEWLEQARAALSGKA